LVDNITRSNFLAQWNGSSLQTIPINPTDLQVLALASYDGKLVVGGYGSSGSVPFLQTYDAGVWTPMVGGPRPDGVDDRVTTLLERDGLLYVGGQFGFAAGQPTPGLAPVGRDHPRSVGQPGSRQRPPGGPRARRDGRTALRRRVRRQRLLLPQRRRVELDDRPRRLVRRRRAGGFSVSRSDCTSAARSRRRPMG
jgi:hypothetical protein